MEKEKEADKFAADYLLSEREEQEILDVPLTISSIRAFAQKFHTHPACIIGRLQHKKLIPFSLGNELIVKIELPL
jgi:hypothetical protein